MKNNKIEDHKSCSTGCEDKFIKQTARTYTGGVEELRSCREKCPDSTPEE